MISLFFISIAALINLSEILFFLFTKFRLAQLFIRKGFIFIKNEIDYFTPVEYENNLISKLVA
jgi:hypothetical protein